MKFIPALKRRGVNIEDTWFHQDGASPHTAGAVIDYFIPDCPGHTSDLNHCGGPNH